MQGEWSFLVKRAGLACVLSLCLALPAAARDPAMVDNEGKPRSERAQWVYHIVAKWGGHVQEAYGADPRQWARAMHEAFLRVPVPTLRAAADARSFSAMNDMLMAVGGSGGRMLPAAAPKALGDPDRDLVYVPVMPCRIIDTRLTGNPIPANGIRDFDLADAVRFSSQGGDTGNCGVGDKGSFAAAALNFTVVGPSAPGYITAFSYLASRPNAATLNYSAGDVRSGFTIVKLDQGSSVFEFSVYSFAQTHLIADVVGYYINPSVSSPQLYGNFWASSVAASPCSDVCMRAGGAAVADASGMVCKNGSGGSYRIEFYHFPGSGSGYYACGQSTYRTAQCSCMRN